MIPVENIFVCIAAPMLLTLFILKGGERRFNLFFILGMAIALLAGLINPILSDLAHQGSLETAIYLAPISEEILKALPILAYVLIFKPEKNNIIVAALAVGIGFATLENGTYITAYGNADLMFALLRGFASGIMHAVNTAIVGFGMCYAFDKKLDVLFTFGLLGAVITYHSIFNMLVTASTDIRHVGWFMPMLTAVIIAFVRNRRTIVYLLKRILQSVKDCNTKKNKENSDEKTQNN